jgi:hypothetical protein
MKVLRRMFGFKREDVGAGRWKPHHEELQKLYSSTDIIYVVRSSRITLASICMYEGNEKCGTKFYLKPGRKRRRIN